MVWSYVCVLVVSQGRMDRYKLTVTDMVVCAEVTTRRAAEVGETWLLSQRDIEDFPIEKEEAALHSSLLAGIMNNRPVEQALAKLLPTHANDLPEELLSLSLSLVAQSRSFSTSLRPEEEIARPYACAELACKR